MRGAARGGTHFAAHRDTREEHISARMGEATCAVGGHISWRVRLRVGRHVLPRREGHMVGDSIEGTHFATRGGTHVAAHGGEGVAVGGTHAGVREAGHF